MFLIVDEERIMRADDEALTLGGHAVATVRLEGVGDQKVCELLRKDAGTWAIRQIGRVQVKVNGTKLRDSRPVEFSLPAELEVASHRVLLRDASASVVGQRLGELLYGLEQSVHQKVLRELKNIDISAGTRESRGRLETELDRQLATVTPPAEVETYLMVQALRQMLTDGIQSFDKRDSRQGGRAELPAGVPDILNRLENILRLSDEPTPAKRLERVEVLLSWAIQRHPQLVPPPTRRLLALTLLRGHLTDLMFGLGPLEGLMTAPDINDIMVLPSGHVFIERAGVIQDSGRRMLSPEVSRKIIERIVSREQRRIDHSSPMVDARVGDGSRLNAIIQPVALRGPALTIRRFADQRLTLSQLVELGTMTENVSQFLIACIHARLNVVISGGTGSGKTTLLNALASQIPSDERIVTVEDTAEINLPQVHVVALQSKPANMEGFNAVPIRKLVRNTLRMRPDRIIVGECRGAEALDMLQAMNTGHDGSLTTVHANSAWDAVGRLEVMSMEAEDVRLPSRALREQIVAAVDLIIQVSRMRGHERRVISMCEVVEVDDRTGTIVMEEIFTYRRKRGVSEASRGSLTFTGYVPQFFEALLEAGAPVTCLS